MFFNILTCDVITTHTSAVIIIIMMMVKGRRSPIHLFIYRLLCQAQQGLGFNSYNILTENEFNINGISGWQYSLRVERTCV